MTQERAQEIAETIWGDIAVAKIMPLQEGVPSYWVGWVDGDLKQSWFHGDSWEDAFDVMRRCVNDPRWPDPYHPLPDEAAYILQRLELAGL